MSWWQGLVLGVVQGLTEFLPVSSSGHLVVAEALVGFSSSGVMVEVVLHVATLLAVVLVYRNVLWDLTRGTVTGDRKAWAYVGLLAVATVPAGLVGVLLKDFFERAFESLLLVGVNFLVTGSFLWSTRGRRQSATAEAPSAGRAVVIGIAQALAILPGISRSGATVSAAMWLGVDPVRAAEFSFLLAIPVIAGAAVLQLPDLSGNVVAVGTGPLALGFLAALFAGVLAIRVFIAVLKQRAFHRFAPYCWTVGVLTILGATL
ncbi:MAG: undecaprenyl-diphosphate phosphatase [Acidobacteria bacterium]|nr:undecaprenyl-diphosphate phosphatase [Acidobacteriota bacterium]